MAAVDLCFLVPGVPADGDAAAEHARRLAAAGHAVTVALCDERPSGRVQARDGEPHVVGLEDALGPHFDVVVAFDWTTTVHLLSVDATRHAYHVERFAHEQLGTWQVERIAAQLSYDLPVDFLAGTPWAARALADVRPDARCVAVTRGVARGTSGGDVVVVLDGDPLPDVLAGRVVIAANSLPGVDDVIRHGENGFLVEPEDDRGAQRFAELLGADDALRERLAAAAKATPWPDPDEAAQAMVAALEELLADEPPAAARWPVRLMGDAMAGVAVFRAEHAALTAYAQRLEGDEAYLMAVKLRQAWHERVPGGVRRLLKPLLRRLRPGS
jgi:hypothetical protein